MNFIKTTSLCLLVTGYLAAGVNHFYNPGSYLRIIPPYIPYPALANMAAGALEIACSLLLVFNKTRAYAAWSIILLLTAFLPVHIDMLISCTISTRHHKSDTFIGLAAFIITACVNVMGMVVHNTS